MSESDNAVSQSRYTVGTAACDGSQILTVSAKIVDRGGWNAFVETLNTQALAIWPDEVEEAEAEAAPRRKRQVAQGEPAEGTFDAQVLNLARDARTQPDFVAYAAGALSRKPLLIKMAVGRLKQRGVWPDSQG